MAPTHTLRLLLEQQTAAYSAKTFLYWNDDEVSYAEFDERVNQVAHGLIAAGVRHASTVALLLGNCPEFLYTFFACAKLGAVVVPINPKLKADEVAYVVQHSQSVLLVAASDLQPMVDDLRARCPAMGTVLLVGEPRPEYRAYATLWEQPRTPPAATVASDDIASIIYTSGTTGTPKGVLLSHANYLFDSDSYCQACQITADDRLLCMLPLFHVNAQVASTLSAMQRGGSLILLEGFSPRTFLPAVARYQATSFSAVPTVYAILNNLPDAKSYDLSHLRVCICGAAPMPVEVFTTFERTYKAFILEGYGLSEGTCVSTLNPLDGRPRKIGSIGVALPGQVVQIVDDAGQVCAPGQIGEIVIHGPNVMQGYLRNEDATRATLKDGWLYTGDLGTVDEEGYFYIQGRKKEMIIRGGENIYPKEIEEILYQHPSIQEAAVVGLPNPTWGEEVAVFLVLGAGQSISAAEVTAYCQQHLADYKCPTVVRVVDALPKTATGKVQKNKMVEVAVTK